MRLGGRGWICRNRRTGVTVIEGVYNQDYFMEQCGAKLQAHHDANDCIPSNVAGDGLGQYNKFFRTTSGALEGARIQITRPSQVT